VAQQTPQPCLTGKINARAAVWLSVQRVGNTFTALVSNDNMSWQHIGQWTPVMSGSAHAAQTPTATPGTSATASPHATATAKPTSTPTAAAGASTTDPVVAPLAFTSWGVLAVGNGDAAGWPHMSNFTMTSAP
jgi:hypothetical protein